MGKILVKASPQIQIGPDGKPQLYYNVGFGGRRGGGDGARGRTKRSYAGSIAGGTLGALGGLAGESRSLGGFLSNLQVGAMQGGALGRRIADSRLVTPRRRQARADILESEKQARARSDAEAQLRGERELNRRRNVMSDTGAYEYQQGEPVSPMNRTLLGRLGGRDMRQFGHDLAAFQSEQEAIAAERARQQKELDKQGFKGDVRQFMEAQKNLPSQQVVDVVSSLTGTAAPVGQQPQVPQQVQQAAGFNQTDKTVDEQLNAPENRDPYSNSVEAAQAEMSEESQQGGGDEGNEGEGLPRNNEMLENFIQQIAQQGGGQ
jgi:hypothetical protein